VSEHEYEPIRGLPGLLPKGERLVWQGAPDWKVLARRTYLGDWVAAYFAAIMVWRLAGGLADGDGLLASVTYMLWVVPVAAAALGIIAALAWATARTTVYTITSRRVVMRIGVALSITINVPFARIASADLKALPRGCGDIALGIGGKDRFAYLALWPHARPWRFGKPQPMMRAVPDASHVATVLAEAIASFQTAHGVTATTAAGGARPAPRQPERPRPGSGMVAAE
jgi:hypothetical protein